MSYIVIYLLKAGIAEPEQTSVARLKQLKQPAITKHFTTEKNTRTTTEELENTFTTIQKSWRWCFLCGVDNSTVSLRVLGDDEKGISCLEV
jgi:hypothetical protein